MAMWNYVLDAFYNSPSYEGLIHRSDEGKKVFFMAPKPGAKGVQCFGNDTLALIEDNGGRHDVAVTQMWAQMPSSAYDAGVWGFFSPCTLNGTYTSSVVDAGSCDQFPTLGQNNTIAEITASTGYMLAASGLPYGQPGHLRGLTLARQFEAVLAAGAPNLLVSSFNEHTGGRVNYTGATGPNVKFNMVRLNVARIIWAYEVTLLKCIHNRAFLKIHNVGWSGLMRMRQNSTGIWNLQSREAVGHGRC